MSKNKGCRGRRKPSLARIINKMGRFMKKNNIDHPPIKESVKRFKKMVVGQK